MNWLIYDLNKKKPSFLMRKLLIPLVAALALPTAINAGISDELHKKCLEARDYAGCVNTNKKPSL